MSFELRHDESPGNGMIRAAVEEVDAILDLPFDRNEQLVDTVHEIRKSIKKIRAIIRLLKDPLGRKNYRFENVFFRDAGHPLSDARDTEILLESTNKLSLLEGAPAKIVNRLSNRFAARRDDIHTLLQAKKVLRNLFENFEQSKKRIKNWPVANWNSVSDALKRSYKRGRNAFKNAKTLPTFENYHEWRKRVKDTTYQARLLEPLWPEIMGLLAEQTHAVSDCLGDDHDLGVLRALLKHDPPMGERNEIAKLLDLINDRQTALRREAEELGARIYQEKPKDYVAQLEAL